MRFPILLPREKCRTLFIYFRLFSLFFFIIHEFKVSLEAEKKKLLRMLLGKSRAHNQK
jgi:hypothetical protein